MRYESSSSPSAAEELEKEDIKQTLSVQRSPDGSGRSTIDNDDQGLPTEQEKAVSRKDVIYVEWEKDDPENPFNWPLRKV